MSYLYAKFEESPCVGTDESTPFNCNPLKYTMGSTLLVVSICMGNPSEQKGLKNPACSSTEEDNKEIGLLKAQNLVRVYKTV